MSSEISVSAKEETISNVTDSAAKTSSTNILDGDDESNLPKHWTKVASKKHPGKFYYFNVATKESLWEHPGKTKALEKEKDIIRNVGEKGKTKVGSSSPRKSSDKLIGLRKNDTQFKRKNVAMERMDKLQKQLEVERSSAKEVKNSVANIPKRTKDESARLAKIDVTSTTPSRKQISAGTNDSTLKSGGVNCKSKQITKKDVGKAMPKKLNKDLALDKRLTVEEAVTIPPKVTGQFKSFKIPKKAKQEPVKSSIFVDIEKLDESRTGCSTSHKTDMCSTDVPVSDSVAKTAPNIVTKVSPAQKLLEAIERGPSPDPLHRASPVTKIVKHSVIPSPAVQKFLQTTERPQVSPPSRESPTCTSTPKVRALTCQKSETSSFVKSPANERLVLIRETLAQEVSQQSTLLDEDAEMTDLSDVTHDHANLTPEAMDWEDISEEVALREVSAVRQLPHGFLDKDSVLDATIPEYGIHLFDRINYTRFVFLVMDTNVFLSHLKGVERLLQKGFPHIGQPILIVPYIVLQELDRIKHREQGRPLSQAASQSIRFLNEHLKQRDPRIKGQSAIEATAHLIPVENPDDHIINCCFQVRQIIAGRAGTDLMLLSNDVNLRNKALVSGLSAFGYGELMAEADRIRFAADDDLREAGGGR